MYKVQRNIRLHRKCNTLTPSHERDAEVKNTSFIIWDSIRLKRRLFVIFSFCLFCILCLDTMLWCCLYLCVVPISKGLTANKVANDSLNVHSKIASKLVILSANDKASVVFLSWLHYKLTNRLAVDRDKPWNLELICGCRAFRLTLCSAPQILSLLKVRFCIWPWALALRLACK